MSKEKGKKLIPLLIAAACAALVVIAAVKGKKTGDGPVKAQESTETEWAVYWYLCGSNLETGDQSATKDLKEMLSVSLPENVKVVIEAGGSRKWGMKEINPEKTTRLLYDGKNLKTLEVLPKADMGDADTLSDFLTWCKREYPARHSMVIMWDHGGGSLYGVSYDQNYNMDCLTYTELKDAFSKAGQKFDIIGFDACLMSSVDTMSSCKDAADYMIASEQLEPVCGWDYAALMNSLQDAGELTAEALGISVCDSYYKACEKEGLADSATLCLCDLTKAEQLIQAYHEKILSRFDRVLISDEEAAVYRRSAVEAENYGANGKSVGYTDMIDLLGFLRTDGRTVDYHLDGLVNDAVVYQVRGSAYNRGCGISCYYPLDSSLRSVLQYVAATAPPEDISLFYRYMINPDLNDNVSGYAERRSISENDILKNHFRAETVSLTESPLESAGDGEILLRLPENVSCSLSAASLKVTGVFEVDNTLFYDGDTMYFWMEEGVYPAGKADFEKGIFSFDGKGRQVTIDGVQFATYVVSDTPEQTLVYTPAVIDDRDGLLFFSYSKPGDSVSFLGAYSGKVHATGMYSMETMFSDYLEEDTDAVRYDSEASSEMSAFDYAFTFDELYGYHEKFGFLGEPSEMEEYLHGDKAEEELSDDTRDLESFVFERLSPLTEGQVVTPIFSCTYTKKLEVPTRETAFFANWETSESITYGSTSRFTFEAGKFSSDYVKMNLYSYMLSDAWGNVAESEPALFQ